MNVVYIMLCNKMQSCVTLHFFADIGNTQCTDKATYWCQNLDKPPRALQNEYTSSLLLIIIGTNVFWVTQSQSPMILGS